MLVLEGRVTMHAMTENAPPPQSLFGRILLKPWEFRHRRLFWGVRIIGGVLLLGLGLFVLSHGSWWAVPFLVGAAGNFVLGYRIYQADRPGQRNGARA